MKIIVRYFPGASGNFICSLVHSMFNSGYIICPDSNGSVHNYGYTYSSSHNFHNIASDHTLVKQVILSKNTLNFKHETDLFFSKIKFDSSNLHIIRSHGILFEPLVYWLGLDQCKIINITNLDSDFDQLCYNFVTKIVLSDNGWSSWRAQHAINQSNLQDKISVTSIANAIQSKDIKFLCWFIRLCREHAFIEHQRYSLPKEMLCYNISWNNIENLGHNLSDLAHFLEVNLTDTIVNNSLASIENYVNSQTKIPVNACLI